MTPSFEIRIPIAPTPAFYSNVRLAALSLAQLGEPYASAPIVVSVGYNADLNAVRAANAWSRDFPIVWYGVPQDVWKMGGYERGAAGERFPPELERDIVVHCDADVCVTGRFDELLSALSKPVPLIAGMMGHHSPFDGGPAKNDEAWRRLFEICDLPPEPLSYSYSLAGPELCGRCPAYFNGGFLAMNKMAWQVLMPLTDRYTRLIRPAVVKAHLAVQIALSLAICRSQIEVLPLGLAYNCPNTDVVFDHGLSSVDDIKVIHYQRADEFDRHAFMNDRDAFTEFASRSFAQRLNEHFRRHVLSIGSPLFASEA